MAASNASGCLISVISFGIVFQMLIEYTTVFNRDRSRYWYRQKKENKNTLMNLRQHFQIICKHVSF